MKTRDILLNEEEFINHAKELARDQKIIVNGNRNDKSLKKLNEDFGEINYIYKKLNEGYKTKSLTIPASEWLLDNFYIIEENTKQIKRDFKKKMYNKLPLISEGESKGYTRVYTIAMEIVAHNDGKVDERIIEKFINAYESEQALFMKEIWALGVAIRIALVNKIRVISEKIYETFLEWEKAEEWVNNYDKEADIKLPVYDLSINSCFLEHLASKLRRVENTGSLILNRIESYIEKYGINIDTISKKEHNKQAALKVSIGNCILSLKYIANIDWNELFNKISTIEQVFVEEPAGTYPEMDLESKNAYRARVQYIADSFGISEVHVAKKCMEYAYRFPNDKIYGHIGYYLWGKGEEELEKIFNIEIPWKYKLKREIDKEPVALYLALIFLTSFFILIGFYSLSSRYIENTGPFFLGMAICTVIAFDGGVCFSNYLLNRIFRPRLIPKMDFKEGIPKDNATMVIVPTLLSNEKRVRDMFDNIEKCYIATNDSNVFFTLIGDAKEGKSETLTEDEDIIKMGLERVEELNIKYNTKSFFFVYRKRFYNKSENKWLGWERKRGAIVRFNNLLLKNDRSDYNAISKGFENLPKIRYVLTVDADTVIPIDAVKKLAGAMAHPLNTPRLNDEGTVVTEGHALIQPHVGIDVVSANKSIFSRTFAGTGGIDPYVCASSDIYQDLFGEAIFTGKGIYDLNTFQKVLEHTIPENAVLSHDLLEGSYLRAGLATDIELIDGYPAKYNAYAMRMHRWIRGDWQVLPWLFYRVRNEEGKKVKNPINRISRWKIFDNLRRSLTVPFIGLLILLSFLILPGSPMWWIAFGLIVGIRGNKKQFAYQVIFLAFQAWLILTAISKTLCRMIFIKKNFLEWVTAADMEIRLKNTLTGFYGLMKSSVIAGASIVLFAWYFKDTLSIIYAIILFLIWSSAPLLAYNISKDKKNKEEILNKDEREKLREYAKKTWNYFDVMMNEKNNFLPPDNYQEDPPNGVAYRTSPTNIGLGMLTLLSAYDLGFIKFDIMLDRLRNILITIDKLEKWNGHLLNWYNTKTLKPLFPRYISTVDSGNLLAYAITAKSALENEAETSEIKDEIIFKLKKLIDEMKFNVLFDKQKNLFSIGYNLEEGRLTNSYYDLFASESRQISFLAIARHEVPIKHWGTLGRSLTRVGNRKGLISWTGTMFEYLMPLLLMKNYKETLLDETYEFVLSSQIEYGKKKNVVWGISESAFYNFDINLNYQYKALGVPWLGLKRRLLDDTVISPYSTMLALMVKPKTSLKNLKELEKLNMLGEYGFYEAIDFTPGRLKFSEKGEKYAIIKSYMAHHQGMSMVAMNNVINDNIMQNRFHEDVYVKSAEALLQEKVPSDIIYTKDSKEKVVPPKEMIVENIDTGRIISGVKVGLPEVNVLTNGSYFVFINDRGSNYSKCGDITISRKRHDYVLEHNGQVFYIKCAQTDEVWSSSYEPCLKKPDKYQVIFSGDKVKFSRKDGCVETNEEIVVSTEDNAEIHRITITNHGEQDLDFEITGYFEIILGSIDADIAHRVFSNMFVITDMIDNIILAYRGNLKNGESNILYSTSFVSSDQPESLQFDTDRMSFMGRGRGKMNPEAVFTGKPLKGRINAVLNPIVAQKRYLRVKGKESGRITFITGLSEDINSAVEVGKKYLSEDAIARAFRLAFARTQVEMAYLNVTSNEVRKYDEMMKNLRVI